MLSMIAVVALAQTQEARRLTVDPSCGMTDMGFYFHVEVETHWVDSETKEPGNARSVYQLNCNRNTGRCSGARLKTDTKEISFLSMGTIDSAEVVLMNDKMAIAKWGVYQFVFDPKAETVTVTAVSSLTGDVERGSASCASPKSFTETLAHASAWLQFSDWVGKKLKGSTTPPVRAQKTERP